MIFFQSLNIRTLYTLFSNEAVVSPCGALASLFVYLFPVQSDIRIPVEHWRAERGANGAMASCIHRISIQRWDLINKSVLKDNYM